MAEKRLTIQGTEPLLLFGFNDVFLRKIESAFPDTQIIARGDQVLMRGDEAAIGVVEQVLRELMLVLNRNGNLTENDVATVLTLFATSPGTAPDGLVAEDNRDVVLFTPTGGTVRAKTPNQARLVESARSNDIVFAIGPAGTGKCVAADTLVLSDRGLVPIEVLASGPPADGYAERRHTIMTMQGPADTSHVYNGGYSPTLRIQTRHGFEIEGTPEHPLLTIDPEGRYAWKQLANLEPGDFVALKRDTQMFGTETGVDFTFARHPNDHTSRDVVLPALDEDYAYFMGLMVGDGCMYKEHRGEAGGSATVMLSTADAEISAHVRQVCDRFGLRSPQYGYDHRINSTQLYALNEHLGVLDVPAYEKRIPHAILRAPRPQVVSFLQGLFDTDGTVDRRNGSVSLTTSSARLASEVQVVLLNLGIVSCRRRKTTTHHDAHTVEIYGCEAERFFDEVSFRLPRKQQRRRPAVTRNPNLDFVPNVAGLIDDAVRSCRFTHTEHKQFEDYRSGRRRPSYARLHSMIDRLAGCGAPVERLQRIAADHFLWSEVTSIENGLAQVYDLTVPEEHNFIAGGFVSHNTYTAVALAVSAMKSRQVKRIVLSRPAVEAGERLGFLPGDLREKIDPYLRPLYDALEDMIPREKLRGYIDQNIVEIVPLAYMRGRTLNSAFVILDEAQNATTTQMKMFLTRLGANSRAIVTGDMTQTDLPRTVESGLAQARQILEGVEGIDFIYFDKGDVVRHRLVQDIIDAYERYLGDGE